MRTIIYQTTTLSIPWLSTVSVKLSPRLLLLSAFCNHYMRSFFGQQSANLYVKTAEHLMKYGAHNIFIALGILGVVYPGANYYFNLLDFSLVLQSIGRIYTGSSFVDTPEYDLWIIHKYKRIWRRNYTISIVKLDCYVVHPGRVCLVKKYSTGIGFVQGNSFDLWGITCTSYSMYCTVTEIQWLWQFIIYWFESRSKFDKLPED